MDQGISISKHTPTSLGLPGHWPSQHQGVPVLDYLAKNAATTERDPLLSETIDALKEKLDPLSQELIPSAVRNSGNYKIQQFFLEQDLALEAGNPTKPVFLSGRHRGLVISASDVDEVLKYLRKARLLDDVPRALSDFAFNRVEFAIHEYGHLASANQCVELIPHSKDKIDEARIKLVTRLEKLQDPNVMRQFKDILADLRAEVFRREYHQYSQLDRKPQIFAEVGVTERVFPGGALYPINVSPSDLLRMIAWHPLCGAMGPKEFWPKVLDSVERSAASSLRWLPRAAAQFFEAYYQNHFFNREKFLAMA